MRDLSSQMATSPAIPYAHILRNTCEHTVSCNLIMWGLVKGVGKMS